MASTYTLEEFLDEHQEEMAKIVDTAIKDALSMETHIVVFEVCGKQFEMFMEHAVMLRHAYKYKEFKLVKKSDA